MQCTTSAQPSEVCLRKQTQTGAVTRLVSRGGLNPNLLASGPVLSPLFTSVHPGRDPGASPAQTLAK